MRADLTMAAVVRFREISDPVVSLPGTITLGSIGNLIGKETKQPGILLAPQHHAIGRIPIAPSAPCLLIKLFDGLGKGRMNPRPKGSLLIPRPNAIVPTSTF